MNEMSEQTRGIIFVVLVVAITFVWVHFFAASSASLRRNPAKPRA